MNLASRHQPPQLRLPRLRGAGSLGPRGLYLSVPKAGRDQRPVWDAPCSAWASFPSCLGAEDPGTEPGAGGLCQETPSGTWRAAGLPNVASTLSNILLWPGTGWGCLSARLCLSVWSGVQPKSRPSPVTAAQPQEVGIPSCF